MVLPVAESLERAAPWWVVVIGAGEIQALDVLRSEVNLLNLPFFALWDKDLHRRRKVEFTDVEEGDGTKLQIL